MVYENGKKVTKDPYYYDKIHECDYQRILDFMQGAVYCWCVARKDDEFAGRDLFGGENRDWQNTPLQRIYDAYQDTDVAGNASGHMLRLCLMNDSRNFEMSEHYRAKHYKWID